MLPHASHAPARRLFFRALTGPATRLPPFSPSDILCCEVEADVLFSFDFFHLAVGERVFRPLLVPAPWARRLFSVRDRFFHRAFLLGKRWPPPQRRDRGFPSNFCNAAGLPISPLVLEWPAMRGISLFPSAPGAGFLMKYLTVLGPVKGHAL